MSGDPLKEHRYEKLTWEEIADCIAAGKIPIVPTGAVEQHGPHLPLDVDMLLSTSVALEAGRRNPTKILVLPSVSYGYTGHVMDFPGTINIHYSHFIEHVLDICKSLAYHGFKKMLLLNGHGSNMPNLDLVARRCNLETDAECGYAGWWSFCCANPKFIAEMARKRVPRRHRPRLRARNEHVPAHRARGRPQGQDPQRHDLVQRRQVEVPLRRPLRLGSGRSDELDLQLLRERRAGRSRTRHGRERPRGLRRSRHAALRIHRRMVGQAGPHAERKSRRGADHADAVGSGEFFEEEEIDQFSGRNSTLLPRYGDLADVCRHTASWQLPELDEVGYGELDENC